MVPAGFRHIGLFSILLLWNIIAPFYARAEGVHFNSEHLYTRSDSDTKIKDTGEKINTDYWRLNQRYNLDVSKTLYPYLTFATGTTYEHDKLENDTENETTKFTEETLRPYVELTLNNPVYQAGVSYRGSRIDEKVSNLPDTRSNRDEYTATAGMTPDPLYPEWTFTYRRTVTDDHPKTIDEELNSYYFETQYNPVRNFLAYYSYLRRDTDDRIRGNDTLDQTHFGKAEYSRNFFDQRLSMNTGYTIRYNTIEFPRNAVFDRALVRSGGFSGQSTDPTDGPALTPNPALVDGNVTASAGIDLGLNGDSTTNTNIAVDLGFPQDVDQIRVWVDRPLTDIVVNDFTWSVYTSPDNLDTSTWTLVATVNPADFGTFDNRFEINFTEVNTQFIKVVTTALSPGDPGSAQFPNIFVTEMEAFITIRGDEIDNETKTTDQNFNFNLRGQVSERTVVGYNLLYSRQDQDPFNVERTQMTNDIFMNHIFNPIFSLTASGQRTDNSFANDDSTNYNYGASLVAIWLKTFNQSLTYSGTYLDQQLGNAYQNSIFLRNNATLYRGWSMFLDTGYGWEKAAQSDSQIISKTVRTGTNVIPNRKLTLNMNFQYKRTEQPDLDIGPQDDTQVDLQGFYIPFNNLSFFAKVSWVDRNNQSDTFQNYTVNWSPFQDGDLQFFFTYSEILASENDRKERVIGPGLKWTIGKFGLLDLSYSLTKNEDAVQKTDSQIVNADLRIIF